MLFEFSYNTRPNQKVSSYRSIPNPTRQDLIEVLKTLESLKERTNFEFSLSEIK